MYQSPKPLNFSDHQRAQYRWHGVSMESSASDSDELDTMLELVGALSPAHRSLIDKIYCESDVHHCRVQLRRGNHEHVSKMLRTCAAVLYTNFGPVRSLTIELDRKKMLQNPSGRIAH